MSLQRPRLSVLTLFDPLSSSSDSIDSDKENEGGDLSFLHLKQPYSPVQRLRRRLIDVGDATVEEPDIRDLIQQELEAEINQSVPLEDDENATLTFRDMAKAATPKWSGKHAARKGTPDSLSTPRTPLAEIVTRDEMTPIGRKKLFKRPVATVPEAIVVHKAENVPTVVVHDFDNTSRNPTFIPPISGADIETRKKTTSPNSMGISTATIELPMSSDPLLSDTPTPFFLSTSSLEPNPPSRTPSPMLGSRLRPNAHVRKSTDRQSVDLQASFQLNLTLETTFDLLNDKISFLGSKSGLESFLDHENASFSDDECLGTMSDAVSSETVDQKPTESEVNIQEFDVSKISEDHVNEPALQLMKKGASFLGRCGMPTSPARQKKPTTLEKVSPLYSSTSEAESGMLPTASSSRSIAQPPRPVPALRIVKKSNALEKTKEKRNSYSVGNIFSASRAPKRSSLEASSSNNGIKNGGQDKAMTRFARSVVRDAKSTDGPQRVLVRETHKRPNIISQSITMEAKSLMGVKGPRRVPGSDAINKVGSIGSTRANGSLLVKNVSVGSVATSGIPKPVMARSSGSKIPAARSGKQGFGVQIETGKGFLGRRVAGK